ncbi:hypothetical protein IWW55_000256 [Coemansia sp. RSA 2706]|nr:hypothetical protein LPJ63_005215 [Coemansia sp. RSA 2711]KAJ2308753.1 hypothetical protein IWW55_000256 [Coemansia sp. RSA 2706]KAJ2315438.1 hypothetical protein IWW54_000279 [Coemansia sp. RSA 2705]KAJ2322328.1 hypothetical protein IWW52_000161 [Coemansia sp. RSA 2704]KAJ2329923.1 hypothetical protein IWW51_000293 [Coemansia sp. RSA 2702]KAJ2370448.1 hypothetical protein H4S01_000359 [Coemansia sp. RSA 2610]KAJ2393675.1 hypothetical protein H4S02_000037 [Coemansia sp. RSA 2611]KAJ273989
MANVLISGVYPAREAGQQEAIKRAEAAESACPLHATATAPAQQYRPTREDESMREALKRLQPISDDFRTGDYARSFNWDEISAAFFEQLATQRGDLPGRAAGEDDWYAVVFRSQRRRDCSNADLFEADRLAYEEAYAATGGALLVYWFAGLDADHNCLATCVWSARDVARSVNALPRHREAARLSADVYVSYHIDRYRIRMDAPRQRLDVAPW